MIYTTRYGACPTCRFKYMSIDDEESPCYGCCHCKTDNYREEVPDNEDSQLRKDEETL